MTTTAFPTFSQSTTVPLLSFLDLGVSLSSLLWFSLFTCAVPLMCCAAIGSRCVTSMKRKVQNRHQKDLNWAILSILRVFATLIRDAYFLLSEIFLGAESLSEAEKLAAFLLPMFAIVLMIFDMWSLFDYRVIYHNYYKWLQFCTELLALMIFNLISFLTVRKTNVSKPSLKIGSSAAQVYGGHAALFLPVNAAGGFLLFFLLLEMLVETKCLTLTRNARAEGEKSFFAFLSENATNVFLTMPTIVAFAVVGFGDLDSTAQLILGAVGVADAFFVELLLLALSLPKFSRFSACATFFCSIWVLLPFSLLFAIIPIYLMAVDDARAADESAQTASFVALIPLASFYVLRIVAPFFCCCCCKFIYVDEEGGEEDKQEDVCMQVYQPNGAIVSAASAVEFHAGFQSARNPADSARHQQPNYNNLTNSSTYYVQQPAQFAPQQFQVVHPVNGIVQRSLY